MGKRLQIDWLLFAAVTALSLFGVLMVYSASAMLAIKETSGANQYVYVIKQFAFTLVGIGAMFTLARVDYRWFRRGQVVGALLLVTIGLLGAVLAFPPVNGAQRWIKFAGLSFQPSELAKLALIVFLAWFLAKRAETMGDLKFTFLPATFVMAILLGLILLEPDLGTAIVIAATFGIVYFAAGAAWRHVGIVAATFLIGVLGAVLLAPWRMRRIFAFLDPWADAEGSGYQVVQSLLAVGSGGVWGVGYAQGAQKIGYLPFAHSDFIFAIVGEEFGLVGCILVLAGFGIILWRGSRAAMLAPDRFGKLLGVGIVTSVIVQAFFNISVVLAMLPTKGIPLPFISYGGSSIVVTLATMGILLNLSQYAGDEDEEDEPLPERPVRRNVRQREVM